MKDFLLKTAIVSIILVVAFNFIKINIGYNFNLNSSEKIINQKLCQYELINETTRFNKVTGDVEYFEKIDDSLLKNPNSIRGSWINIMYKK